MDTFASLINVLIMILGFGLLIFIHELGHFLAAKWANIRVESFAVGFGPPVLSWRQGIGLRWGSTDPVVRRRAGRSAMQMRDWELREENVGETEYSLRWLPLGGFVRMLGQDDLDPTSQSADPRSFNSATIGRRMLVIAAGVIMNVLLAIVCFVIAFSIGVQFEAPVVGQVLPDSPASLAVPTQQDVGLGLRSGDRILRIDGDETPTFADLQVIGAMSVEGQLLHLDVERPGADHVLSFTLTPEHDPLTGTRSLGVYPASSTSLSSDGAAKRYVQASLDRTGLSASGVQAGSTLETIDGTTVTMFSQVDAVIERVGGTAVATSWRQADGSVVESSFEPAPQWEQLRYPDATSEDLVGWEQGVAGLVPLVRIADVPPGSINEGLLQTGDVVLSCGGVMAPRMRGFRRAVWQATSTLPMLVLRDGQRIEVEAKVVMDGVLDPKPMLQILPAYAFDTPLIASPMREIELADGTVVRSAAGDVPDGLIGTSVIRSIAGTDVKNWRDIWEGLHGAATKGIDQVELVIGLPSTTGSERVVQLQLAGGAGTRLADLRWQSPIPELLFEPLYVERSSHGNPITAISMGASETSNFVVLTYLTIDRLFRGTLGVDQLRGPVGIVHLGTRVVDRGFTYLLFFLAIISVNLAVLNFLPLPIVDGGQFSYLLYEKCTGRAPSLAFQTGGMMIGLLLIGVLFVVTFYNDVVRLIG